MAFASIHVPEFPVQAVVRAEPSLRGRAVALIEGNPPLAHVVAANLPALEAGIELGMTKTQAGDFSVEIRPRSPAQEKAAHAALLDLGWSASPRVEDTAQDTILLDLAGLGSLSGADEAIAHRLAQQAEGLGLNVNVAVASNVEAARLASRGFSGVSLVPPGEEAKYLGCLPVDALSPSAEILETLDRWGVRTCAALAALPVVDLSERLGQEGVRLHELARGANSRSLVLAEPDHSFIEEMELEDAVEELEPLAFLLARLLGQLCARLEARSLAAAAIHTRFELEPSFEKDFLRANDSRRKPPSKTYKKTLALPVPMRDPKVLLKLLRLQLEGSPPAAPILKIALMAEPARPRFAQGGLFLPVAPDPEKLELTIARLANLVGDENVGSPEIADTHRPDEFQMRRFHSPREASEAAGKATTKNGTTAAVTATAVSVEHRPAAIFRVFRPCAPAVVELRDGTPARVRFRGMRGDVLAASGPWRTSGDWWREDGWHNDEWDVELQFHSNSPQAMRGLYRIYFDSIRQCWFVRGMYD